MSKSALPGPGVAMKAATIWTSSSAIARWLLGTSFGVSTPRVVVCGQQRKRFHASDIRINVVKVSFTLYSLRQSSNRRFIEDGNLPYNV
jgi:hypothetical protein